MSSSSGQLKDGHFFFLSHQVKVSEVRWTHMKMVVPSVIDDLIADDIHSLLKVKATNKKVQRCVFLAQKILPPSMSRNFPFLGLILFSHSAFYWDSVTPLFVWKIYRWLTMSLLVSVCLSECLSFPSPVCISLENYSEICHCTKLSMLKPNKYSRSLPTDQKGLGCHVSRQEVSRFRTRGQSEESTACR